MSGICFIWNGARNSRTKGSGQGCWWNKMAMYWSRSKLGGGIMWCPYTTWSTFIFSRGLTNNNFKMETVSNDFFPLKFQVDYSFKFWAHQKKNVSDVQRTSLLLPRMPNQEWLLQCLILNRAHGNLGRGSGVKRLKKLTIDAFESIFNVYEIED